MNRNSCLSCNEVWKMWQIREREMTRSLVILSYNVIWVTVTWKREISLTLSVCLSVLQESQDPHAQPVCQHPVMERSPAGLEGGLTALFRDRHGHHNGDSSVSLPLYCSISPLPVIASAHEGFTPTVYRTTLFVNIKLCQVKVQGLSVMVFDCRNLFKAMHRQTNP